MILNRPFWLLWLAYSHAIAFLFKESIIDGALWNASVFAITPIMPTYLLAFAVCDFTYNETFTTTGVQVSLEFSKRPLKRKDT